MTDHRPVSFALHGRWVPRDHVRRHPGRALSVARRAATHRTSPPHHSRPPAGVHTFSTVTLPARPRLWARFTSPRAPRCAPARNPLPKRSRERAAIPTQPTRALRPDASHPADSVQRVLVSPR